MSGLADILKARIRSSGPISIADFMSECLHHPQHGYYATRDPLGAAGDFTTAPEISQMFGELIGLSLAQAWLDRGAPAPFVLAELGPGRGTLMADMLRATSAIPGFHAAMELHLVETSPVLRDSQSRTIACPLTHHDTLATLPDAPLFLVANEFFDALPIRQFRRDGAAWREHLVGLKDEALAPGLSAPLDPPFLSARKADTRDGDVVEYCAQAQTVANELGARISNRGGMALLIDYGDWHSLGDTFQALQDHRTVSPFEAPGRADLTAHVDFEALALAAEPAHHTRLTPQGIFLERLGITPRAQALAAGLTGEALEIHVAAHRRLTHPAEMGTLFKMIALYQPDSPLPPGFEP